MIEVVRVRMDSDEFWPHHRVLVSLAIEKSGGAVVSGDDGRHLSTVPAMCQAALLYDVNGSTP